MPLKTITLPKPIEPDEDDIIVSYSELDTYRQCPLKHFLAYGQRWTKPKDENSALAKGTLWHLVLEEHYGVIKRYQDLHDGAMPRKVAEVNRLLEECRARVFEFFVDRESGRQSEVQALIEWMYDGHIAKYGLDAQWRILAVEYRLQARLPYHNGAPSPFLLKAKLDLIVQDRRTGKVWVIDHKSGANLPSQMDLEIDDQFGLYTWLLQSQGVPVLGSIHDANRTTRNLGDFTPTPPGKKPQTLDARMSRTTLNRTGQEAHNIAVDATNAACNAYPEAAGFDPLPLYSSPDPRQCGWKCDFKDVHLQARTGRDIQEALVEQGFKQDFTRH